MFDQVMVLFLSIYHCVSRACWGVLASSDSSLYAWIQSLELRTLDEPLNWKDTGHLQNSLGLHVLLILLFFVLV